MTALPGRRRRATLVAGIATVAVLLLATGLTVLGAVTLYNSTEGADPSPAEPELTFPDTPTGALAVLDDTGALASIAVFVVQPAGVGGSIVAVPVSADASSGAGDERLPLAETVALQGADVARPGARGDAAPAARPGRRARRGRRRRAAGAGRRAGGRPAGRCHRRRRGDRRRGRRVDDRCRARRRRSWPPVPRTSRRCSSTARPPPSGRRSTTTVGDGLTATASPPTPRPATWPPWWGGCSAAASATGRCGRREPSADANPRQVDVVVLDAVELVLVFGQIAPSAVAAPSSGLTFRVVCSFTDEQLAGVGAHEHRHRLRRGLVPALRGGQRGVGDDGRRSARGARRASRSPTRRWCRRRPRPTSCSVPSTSPCPSDRSPGSTPSSSSAPTTSSSCSRARRCPTATTTASTAAPSTTEGADG